MAPAPTHTKSHQTKPAQTKDSQIYRLAQESKGCLAGRAAAVKGEAEEANLERGCKVVIVNHPARRRPLQSRRGHNQAIQSPRRNGCWRSCMQRQQRSRLLLVLLLLVSAIVCLQCQEPRVTVVGTGISGLIAACLKDVSVYR